MPTNETTPLNQAVSNLMTSQNVARAREVASARVADVRTSIVTGDFSLRLLVLIGAIGLIVSVLFDIFRDVFSLNVTSVILEMYTLALACMILVLESQQLSLPPAYLQILLKYAAFLKFIWGRGFLYTFAGTLQTAQGSTLDYIFGTYLAVMGIVFIGLGYMTAQKLATVGRRRVSADALRRKFNAADTDRKGKLDLAQFSALVDSLDFPLNSREKEVAFLYLDGGEGTLTFDEFKAWFDQDNAAPII